MDLNLSSLMTEDENGQPMTTGEGRIIDMLEAIQDQLDELTEKVNNINLSDSDGLSIDSY